MKKYISILFLLCLISCTKDLELSFKKSDQPLVVNCLFSEDSDWKVILSRVKPYDDTTEIYINNARVGIVPEGQDTIRLNFLGNGVYSAEIRPAKGVQYQLAVKHQGRILRAESAIPSPANVSSVQIAGEHTVFYSNANLTDYEVIPVTLNITPADIKNYVRLRFYSLNTNKITHYTVTEKTIETLRAKQYPEKFLTDLSGLIGKQISGYNIKSEVLYKIMYMHEIYSNQSEKEVFAAIEKSEAGPRDETTFEPELIFSNSSWASNISRDTYNVLGQIDQPKETSLFASYYTIMNKNNRTDYTEEYWLEVVSMSEDYYKYQKSYINQITNINNPFASAIEVYTNIQNGVGIFAGYSRQMIHFQDF